MPRLARLVGGVRPSLALGAVHFPKRAPRASASALRATRSPSLCHLWCGHVGACTCVVGGAPPCGSPPGREGLPSHASGVSWGARVGTWPYLIVSAAAAAAFLSFFTHGSFIFRCAPRVARGVVYLFLRRGDWRTEGAQGVLACPLGVTELCGACEC